jgi:hypothetical protein
MLTRSTSRHSYTSSFSATRASISAVFDATVEFCASTVIRKTGSVPDGRTRRRPVDPRVASALF